MPDVNTFLEQVKNGDLDAVRASLDADASLLNATNQFGQSPLLLAKYYRQEQVARYLLSLNPKLDIFNASVAGKADAAIAELDRDPALLHAHNSDGWAPLHLAAFFGHPQLAA